MSLVDGKATQSMMSLRKLFIFDSDEYARVVDIMNGTDYT